MNVSRDGVIDTSALKFVERQDGQRIDRGDVLFNNTNSPELVGKTAYFNLDGDWAYSNHMTRLRPSAAMDGRFLALQLHWLWMCGSYSSVMNNHVNQASVATKTLLSRVQVIVPPLAEQRRIVAAIEEQLSRLDTAVATLRTVQARAAMGRRTVLAAAFSQYRFRVPLNDATDPQRPICYGILKPRTTGDLVVPYVEVRSIRDGRIDLDLLHSTTLDLHREFARSTLRSGDVVIAVRGSWDRAAVVPAELEGANVSRDVARVAPLPQMNAQFLSYFLASPVAGAYFGSVARGVGVRGVNIGDLRQLPVPCPALEEQAATVERVEAGLDAVDRAAHAAATAIRRAGSLRRSILATAFRGDLIPQNEDGEPASAVLERIAVERDVATNPARPRHETAPA